MNYLALKNYLIFSSFSYLNRVVLLLTFKLICIEIDLDNYLIVVIRLSMSSGLIWIKIDFIK